MKSDIIRYISFSDKGTGVWATYVEDKTKNSWRCKEYSRNFFLVFPEFDSIMTDSEIMQLYMKYLEG